MLHVIVIDVSMTNTFSMVWFLFFKSSVLLVLFKKKNVVKDGLAKEIVVIIANFIVNWATAGSRWLPQNSKRRFMKSCDVTNLVFQFFTLISNNCVTYKTVLVIKIRMWVLNVSTCIKVKYTGELRLIKLISKAL